MNYQQQDRQFERTQKYEMVQKFMDDNRKWSDKKFGNMSAVSVLKHLKKEVTETIKAIKDEQKSGKPHKRKETKFEFADCYLLFLNAASRHGFSFMDIHETGVAKMNVNRKREWGEINKQGFVEHIEPNKNKVSIKNKTKKVK